MTKDELEVALTESKEVARGRDARIEELEAAIEEARIQIEDSEKSRAELEKVLAGRVQQVRQLQAALGV